MPGVVFFEMQSSNVAFIQITDSSFSPLSLIFLSIELFWGPWTCLILWFWSLGHNWQSSWVIPVQCLRVAPGDAQETCSLEDQSMAYSPLNFLLDNFILKRSRRNFLTLSILKVLFYLFYLTTNGFIVYCYLHFFASLYDSRRIDSNLSLLRITNNFRKLLSSKPFIRLLNHLLFYIWVACTRFSIDNWKITVSTELPPTYFSSSSTSCYFSYLLWASNTIWMK